MANEGFLGKTKITGEKAATDDHPVIIHALPLDDSVTGPLAPGLLMERTDSNTYQPYDPAGGAKPCAVVNEPCDPTGDNPETSAKCIVHGCVKTRLLQVGSDPADADALAALMDCGIFAV
jgi:hypothetical protein